MCAVFSLILYIQLECNSFKLDDDDDDAVADISSHSAFGYMRNGFMPPTTSSIFHHIYIFYRFQQSQQKITLTHIFLWRIYLTLGRSRKRKN